MGDDYLSRIKQELRINPKEDWTQFAKDIQTAISEIERLRKLHERNLKDARPSYDNEGHRCDWRVRAEAMAERSRAALEKNDDGI